MISPKVLDVSLELRKLTKQAKRISRKAEAEGDLSVCCKALHQVRETLLAVASRDDKERELEALQSPAATNAEVMAALEAEAEKRATARLSELLAEAKAKVSR